MRVLRRSAVRLRCMPSYMRPVAAGWCAAFRMRRVTHHRLFPTQARLKQAWRNSLCDYQTLKHRVLSLIQSPKKRTQLSAA
jgi:hypothetical protein